MNTVPASVTDSELLAALERRRESRKLFIEYNQPIADPTSPPSITNSGPYPWQVEFHNAGKDNPERLLQAANRVGKTRTAAAEIAIHATGEYPSWWQGRRFEGATRIWVAAESTEDIKNVTQLALLGPPGKHGTGWIPGEKLVNVTWRQAGIPEVMEAISVRHVTGQVSRIIAKTYQMEERGFRGDSLDVFWADELIPMNIYTEGLTRILDRRGLMMVTFTPARGSEDVVHHFKSKPANSGIYIKNATWGDTSHLDPDRQKQLLASYPEWERDMRSKGMELMGSGAVFPVSDDVVTIPPFEIPSHWARINGIDFGVDHPAAGAFCAHDRDTDTFYVYDAYRAPGESPVYHASAMKKHGDWIPTAWPHDGLSREKGSLVPLKNQYRSHGLYMLKEHAQYPDARANSLDVSLQEMYEYMRTGKFKVFSTLPLWFEEKRMYHRDAGLVIKKRDDIISATRYAFMMRRYAQPRPAPVANRPRFKGPIVGGVRA